MLGCLHGQTREKLGFLGRAGWETGLGKVGKKGGKEYVGRIQEARPWDS